MLIKFLSFFVHILLLTECTLTPKSRKSGEKGSKPDKSEVVRSGPDEIDVFEKNLVVNPPTAKEIINNHKAYCKKTHIKRTQGKSLAYITPWNNNGYNAAFIFANKFTHISPVWLQAKRVDKGVYEILGQHDVDKDWMADVKRAGKANNLKIVPRIILENWLAEDYVKLSMMQDEWDGFSNTLIRTAQKHKFDGYVIEIWSQVIGRLRSDLIINLVQEVSMRVRKEKLEIILVIPPMRSKTPLFDQNNFNDLYDYVDGFSLMTYDFSNVHRPGPNAPIRWIEDCVKLIAPDIEKREKIFTGFNLYGYDFTPSGGGAVINHDYLKLLKKFKGKLQIDEKSQEHYFEVKEEDGKHIIFYPTLFTINERVKLVNKLGTGVSIWELGQGLDYFFDLF
ncbi:chitinase domain-containing protein 1 [Onthophagus taurus]|uniref:chitinase domain-containing protein 1 n=1 Tax=Onthophagus taurus TaxID=166361 RepID=UPI000C20962E|nr:chitinase domain-containing protein 1 [Onthophagus taurus]